jgi:hypothetical protein
VIGSLDTGCWIGWIGWISWIGWIGWIGWIKLDRLDIAKPQTNNPKPAQRIKQLNL